MTLESDRIEVLKMVEAKQVTPEEGARLLTALSDERRPSGPPRPGSSAVPSNGRWFKLQVQEPGRQSVNLTLPLVALPAILRVTRRWVPEEHRDMLDAVAEAVTTDFRGELLRVDEPGGQSVRVWIE